jgi:hypothetical protein
MRQYGSSKMFWQEVVLAKESNASQSSISPPNTIKVVSEQMGDWADWLVFIQYAEWTQVKSAWLRSFATLSFLFTTYFTPPKSSTRIFLHRKWNQESGRLIHISVQKTTVGKCLQLHPSLSRAVPNEWATWCSLSEMKASGIEYKL